MSFLSLQQTQLKLNATFTRIVSFFIQSAIDGAKFDRIVHVKSVKKAWDILVKYYERGEKGQKQKVAVFTQTI